MDLLPVEVGVRELHRDHLVCGLGFVVWGVGFGVWGFGFRVSGFGFKV